MASFDNSSRTSVAGVTRIDGTAANDDISLSGTFILAGDGSGAIVGGTGTDTLALTSASLQGTTIAGIEATQFANNGFQAIDADQIANLGAITLTGNASAFGGFVRLGGADGDTADFSGLSLADGEELTVQSNFLSAGDEITVDFSGGSFAGSSFVDYNGNAADDIVTGGAGDDELSGGSGDDVLIGGAGDDDLEGGSGDNDLRGGAGDDTVRSTTTATGTLDGGADDDRIEVNGFFQNGAIVGGTGTDTLALTSASLQGTTIAGIEATQFANNGFQAIDADQIANLGAITLTGNASAFGGFVRLGGADGDTADFSGLSLADGEELTVQSNFLSAGDEITVDFSGGSFAGSSFVDYNGNAADDIVTGGAGDDELSGGSGDDVLIGGAGDDDLEGGSGDNDLRGGAGDDTVRSTTTATGTLDGGADDDRIEVNGFFQNGAIVGGTGTDTLALTSASLQGTTIAGIEATQFANNGFQAIDADQIANLGAITLTGNASAFGGFVRLGGADGDTADFSGLSLADGEELTVQSNFLSAGDEITVDFSGGSFAGSSFVDYNGNAADDIVTGGAGDDELSGGSGDDVLIGGAGDDDLEGGSGDNDLRGGAGDDTVRSTTTATGTLDGGADDDRIEVNGFFQNGAIVGGTGTDTLALTSASLQGTTIAGIEATQFANNGFQAIDADQIANLGAITLTGNASAFGGFVRLGGADGDTADFSGLSLADGEELTVQSNFLSAGDEITVDFSGGSFAGSSFVDYNGNAADDIVTGGAGDDELSGGSGDDVLIGGAGDDDLEGGSGDNDLRGGAGDDTVRSTTTATGTLDGGADDDRIEVNGFFQNGAIVGGTGTDTLALTSASLQGTTIAGIEATQFANNGTMTIDADQIANLGNITLTGNASAFGVSLTLNDADGLTVSLANLALDDNEDITVRTNGTAGDTTTVDLSTIALGTGNTIAFVNSGATETVIGSRATDVLRGSSPDTVSYAADTEGVTIDLRSDTVSGGQAEGDTISGFGNATGGSGADILIGDTGANRLDGGAGSDVAVFQGNRADYTIEVTDNVAVVTDTNGFTNGFDGIDTVVNVETLRFADQDVILAVPDVPQLSLTGTPSGNEGDAGTTDFTFTVTRSGTTAGTSSVDFAVTGGTADGADFVGGARPSGTVAFAAGETEKTITIQVAGDIDFEGDETFTVALSNPTDAEIVGGTATGTISDDDALPGLRISDAAAQAEGDSGTTDFTFTVTRTGELNRPSTVDYAVQPGLVTAEDFDGGVLPSGSVSFAAGESSKTITISVAGDTLPEGDETIVVRLSDPTDAVLIDATGVATITNDDPFEPTIRIADADTQAEGDSGTTTFSFTLTRSGILTDASSVDYAVAGGTANAADFAGGMLPSGTVNFAAGEDTATLEIEVAGDTDIEGDETIRVVLSAPNNAIIGDGIAIGVVTNDDDALPTLSVSDAGPQDEGDAGETTFTFTVTRSGDLGGTSAVDYAVSGTVDAGDFVGGVLPSGTVAFAAGQSTATIELPIAGDTDVEANESLVVTLSNASGATVADGTGVSTVRNDDAAPPVLELGDGVTVTEGDSGTTEISFEVTRSGDLSGISSASYAVTSGEADAADFVGGVLPAGTVSFAAGEDTATITLEIAGDTTFEPDETLVLSLSAPAGATIGDGTGVATIANDDAAPLPTLSIADADDADEGDDGDATAFAFTVTRGGDLTEASSVEFAVAGGDTNSADFVGGTLPSGTVDFAAGASTATVTVTVAGDTVVEADETLRIVLSDPSNAVIVDGVATASILNDDASPLPTLSIADGGTVDEGDVGTTDLTFTVTRAGDLSGAASADYTVAGTVDGADFAGGALPSGTVAFAAGAASATITLAVQGDTVAEPDETVTVTLSDVVGATLADATATATIADDDAAPLPVVAGTAGIDFLVGTGAAERIEARGGPLDQVFGGGGADVFVFADIAGARDVMTVQDFAAEDRLDLGGATVSQTISLGGSSYLVLEGDDGDLVVLNGVADYEDSLLLV